MEDEIVVVVGIVVQVVAVVDSGASLIVTVYGVPSTVTVVWKISDAVVVCVSIAVVE